MSTFQVGDKVKWCGLEGVVIGMHKIELEVEE